MLVRGRLLGPVARWTWCAVPERAGRRAMLWQVAKASGCAEYRRRDPAWFERTAWPWEVSL